MKFSLPSINHDRAGFAKLIELNAEAAKASFDEIEVDMASCTWLAADMCAPLGAVLYRASADLNEIRLTNVRSDVERTFCRNGFLSHYGREKMPDAWGSTIPYQRFEVKDDRFFGKYIEDKFMGRSGMPRMSVALQRKSRESVFDIFSNAVIHSQTKLGIFSCGQFFPRKRRLVFSVADLGIGIRENVKQATGRDMAAYQAIVWATEGSNTTKKDRIPGGIGLKILREFIALNRGSLLIVSDAGYWGFSEGTVSAVAYPHPFPGTVVNIEIDTSDQQSYVLSSELSPHEIF